MYTTHSSINRLCQVQKSRTKNKKLQTKVLGKCILCFLKKNEKLHKKNETILTDHMHVRIGEESDTFILRSLLFYYCFSFTIKLLKWFSHEVEYCCCCCCSLWKTSSMEPLKTFAGSVPAMRLETMPSLVTILHIQLQFNAITLIFRFQRKNLENCSIYLGIFTEDYSRVIYTIFSNHADAWSKWTESAPVLLYRKWLQPKWTFRIAKTMWRSSCRCFLARYYYWWCRWHLLLSVLRARIWLPLLLLNSTDRCVANDGNIISEVFSDFTS